MWQFITVERNGDGERASRQAIGEVTHTLTHRRYHFRVFAYREAETKRAGMTRRGKWVSLAQLDRYPLPRPHLKIALMLKELPLKR